MDKQCTCTVCGESYTCDKMTKLCYVCRSSDKNVFNLIREYLYAYPGASINQVTEETGVSSASVLKFLREGRIETVGALKVLHCEECGASISFGRICDNCERKKNHGFTSSSVSSRSTSQVMHIKKKKK